MRKLFASNVLVSGLYGPGAKIDQVVRDLKGKFAFILYDSSSKTTFIADDADGSVPFFWGADAEGHLVLSDDVGIMKKGRGKSFAPFPNGVIHHKAM